MVDTISETSRNTGRSDRAREPARAHRLAAAVFVAMCATGALITWLVYAAEMANRQARLDQQLFQAARLIETRIEQHVAFLTATRAFLSTREELPDRETFSTFVRGLSLRGTYAGLQGIGLSLVLEPGEDQEVAADIASNYALERSVWPETADDFRTVIVLLEPADARNLAAIGYDMATEERRRLAMRRAMQTGEPSATSPLILVQEITEIQQTGILVYLPFSPGGELQGFVYSPIRMGDLFQAALENQQLPIEIRAEDTASPDPSLYETPGFEAAAADGRPTTQLARHIAGKDWTFTGVATRGFVAAERPRFTFLTAGAFALLVVASGVAAHSQRTALRRAKALDLEVGRRVRQKDFLLREMSHRIKNSIGRTLAIVRQSSLNAASKEEFVESVTIRLRAMAAAQDLLVASGTDRADLAELFALELRQLYGGKVHPDVMRGPRVSLDAQQTLALGLAVHELATNSLKYGAAASPEGRLKLTWRIETPETGRELVIVWDEFVPEGAPVSAVIPTTGTGFGTKLIEACVRSDLGGSVSRHSHAEGLVVEIRVPLS